MSTEVAEDKVIASIENGNFSIYTFVEEGDNVEELLKKANKKYQCMSYEEYSQKQKDYYMKSCKAVTEENYWEMLEVLPPIYIGKDYSIPGYCVLNAFMVSEPLTLIYYSGYIKYRNTKYHFTLYTLVVKYLI